MPNWFWYIPAGAIAALTLYVLYRHFFVKKGDCCSDCGKDCASCNKNCGKRK
ncbi:MAG: hypothetical protein K6G56_07555 [Clostridiales bacterium]|nr:hypothetical protein [Clostridiales bacterium]